MNNEFKNHLPFRAISMCESKPPHLSQVLNKNIRFHLLKVYFTADLMSLFYDTIALSFFQTPIDTLTRS